MWVYLTYNLGYANLHTGAEGSIKPSFFERPIGTHKLEVVLKVGGNTMKTENITVSETGV
jgi:hypothetical protein